MLAVTDAAIAAQNAVTAAWSLGIGSCYIGDIMERCETHRELLHLPDYVFPAVMVVFGYPTRQQMDRKKPERCPRNYIVHENGYHRLTKEDLEGMLKKEQRKGEMKQWLQAFFPDSMGVFATFLIFGNVVWKTYLEIFLIFLLSSFGW